MAFSVEKLSLSMDKLIDETNWVQWKYNMQLTLEAAELWDLVAADAVLPPEPVATDFKKPEEYAVAKDTHQQIVKDINLRMIKAKMLISNGTSQKSSKHVVGAATPKMMWDRLISAYEHSSVDKLDCLFNEFCLAQKDESASVADHVSYMQALFNQIENECRLIDPDARLPGQLLVCRIVSSLGTESDLF
jgi:hypothetical protein